MYPYTRLRRLRANQIIRDLVSETRLNLSELIYPLFIVSGKNINKPIKSMPGVSQLSVDLIVKEVEFLKKLGINSFLLFGIPSHKDEIGSSSWDDNGIVQTAIKAIKDSVNNVNLIADLCFCEYTSHGHCGVLHDNCVDNDQTLENLQKQTISLTKAGADIVAPSGMMDGMVQAIREALINEGYNNTLIMSYAAKYASSFYGPFREAAECNPGFGDRKAYQMNPCNINEALREVELDINESADIIMVKPGMPYLDVVREIRNNFNIPICVYQVSGEFAMIKSAIQNGWIDEKNSIYESLISFKRAGANMIITYFAKEFAQTING